MKILISPAKKMRTDTDTLSPQALPAFLPETERLLSALRSLSRQELKQLWRCSDAITDLNVERLARMELGKGLTPALLSYQGIQYQYMAPGVFETGPVHLSSGTSAHPLRLLWHAPPLRRRDALPPGDAGPSVGERLP